jgi:hypothetical protein
MIHHFSPMPIELPIMVMLTLSFALAWHDQPNGSEIRSSAKEDRDRNRQGKHDPN